MKRLWIAIGVVVALILVGAVGPVLADNGRNRPVSQDTGRLVITKLFRGIANAATGWLEIPKQITLTQQTMGAGSAYTWGLLKGIGYALARSVTGAFEIATFPFPVPEGYVPVMHPEYVLSDLPTDPHPR